MFIDFLEREGRGERDIDVRERHQLVVSRTCLYWRLNPKFRCVP